MTSTPAESKRLKKTKRRERRAVEIADEDKAKVTSGSDGDASEKRTQHRHGNLCIPAFLTHKCKAVVPGMDATKQCWISYGVYKM